MSIIKLSHDLYVCVVHTSYGDLESYASTRKEAMRLGFHDLSL